MKKALICGVSGQDGSYLAHLLLSKGYQVWGTSRDAQLASLCNLEILGIKNKVILLSMAQRDFRSVLDALTASEPDEIYFLSGQSSVGLSFEQPAESIESIVRGALNLLEAVRWLGINPRIYHASSSECFGHISPGEVATELSPFKPKSPYGVAKSSAHWLFANYREAYGLFCCNGILFNHESPLRPRRFVTRKIVSSACRIAAGYDEPLFLGSLEISRDWGWAPEYVEAMWLMLQNDFPDDYVVSTGMSHTLQSLVSSIFRHLDLDWKQYVQVNPDFFRPSEIMYSAGSSDKALRVLGWQAEVSFEELTKRLVSAEQLSVGALV